MLSVEAARERMLTGVSITAGERISLDRCLGRVPVSFSVVAGIDLPPFANSSMDGFAARVADLPGDLRVVGEVAAGAATLPTVASGSAVRIMTGAPLPPGADTVVPIESAVEDGASVRLPGAPSGQYVRAAGHDVASGTSVELPHAPLGPPSIGLLAALGVAELDVRRRPSVAILSTGDELVPPGSPLGPGQIYDANSFALAAAVREAGGEPMVMPIVGDEPQLVERRLREAAEGADLLVVSGGVSVGRHDHVRAAIETLGELGFWRIAVQPGKPLAFGTVGGRAVIGLPGNPVSALVTFELFVRPMLRAMLGLPGDGRVRLRARAAERMPKDRGRRAYLRVRVVDGDDGYRAESAGGQQSSQLRAMVDANALLVVPEAAAAAEIGESYEALMLGELR
jgi:molybdopterin molybdotransferase